MSEKNRPSLIPLNAVRPETEEYIIPTLEGLLADARAGKVRQLFVVWEDDKGLASTARCSGIRPRWMLAGLVQWGLHRLFEGD